MKENLYRITSSYLRLSVHQFKIMFYKIDTFYGSPLKFVHERDNYVISACLLACIVWCAVCNYFVDLCYIYPLSSVENSVAENNFFSVALWTND